MNKLIKEMANDYAIFMAKTGCKLDIHQLARLENTMNIIWLEAQNVVLKQQVADLDKKVDGLRYCVVRTYSAGVHIGELKEFGEKYPQSAKLLNSRRLHSWSGACSLSQVAMDGVSADSRIAMEIPEIDLTDVIEVIPCSEKAAEFFKRAKAWKK